MTVTPEATDEELAAAVSNGDRQAFAVFYDRHFRGVYDLSVRMMRDPDLAADNVQNSFLRAWRSLQKRMLTGNIRAWLYAIARNNAIDELRRRKRLIPFAAAGTEEPPSRQFTEIDEARFSDPEAVLEDRELVDLVWDSAAALSPREYSLLDLHVRKGLTHDEMAAALGIPKRNVYVMLSRLRDSLEESVTLAVLSRRGRDDCAELDAILAGAAGAQLSPELRRRVRRHVAECEGCKNSRKRYLAAAEIFSGLALFPVNQDLAAALWLRISGLTGAGAALLAAMHWLLGQAGRWWPRLRVPALGAGAATAAVVSLTVIALLLSKGSETATNHAVGDGVAAATTATPRPSSAPPSIQPEPTPTAEPLPRATPVAAAAVASPAATPLPRASAAGATPRFVSGPPRRPVPTPAAAPGASPGPGPAPPLSVLIDIKIGSTPNGLNPNGHQAVSVAIFGSDSLPAGAVDISSVLLAGAASDRSALRDVNGDGRPDLVLQFRIAVSIAPQTGQLCLSGRTLQGAPLLGCDTIRLLGPR